MSKTDNRPTQQYQSIFSVFAKAYWTLLGNAILFFTAVFIVQHKGSMFHTADIVFWVNIAALIFTRYLDIKFWSGLTATGEPATMRHWQKYAAILLIAAAVAWTALHLINYRFINAG